MSWSARIAHTGTGLAIVFAGPVSRLDMTNDVAAHLARLLAAEAQTPRNPNAAEVSNSGQLPRFSRRNPNASIEVIGRHPLCCDCDECLNGVSDEGERDG